MSGKGIHEAFAICPQAIDYFETRQKTAMRARQYDEQMGPGKEQAFRIRRLLREAEKRRLAGEE